MTYISGVRLRRAMFVGALAGVGAGLTFATAHALIIVPIWGRMFDGLAFAALAGAVGGWAYAELFPERVHAGARSAAAAGVLFGALLWLAAAPVTGMDALLRATGLSLNQEAAGVVVALLLVATAGALLGWYRVHRLRGAVAGAAATTLLTVAMRGPVPIGNSARAFAIFAAVLPAAMVAGAILATSISLTTKARRPAG